MKMVIAGSKYDGPDICRLKLHEEYGRVWLYVADAEGRSLQNGRLLCVDDDGRLRIHVDYCMNTNGEIWLELPTPYADTKGSSVDHEDHPAVPVRSGLQDTEPFEDGGCPRCKDEDEWNSKYDND